MKKVFLPILLFTLMVMGVNQVYSQECEPHTENITEDIYFQHQGTMDCWSKIDRLNTGADHSWSIRKTGIPIAKYQCTEEHKGADDWLISPPMTIPSGYSLKVKYKASANADYNKEIISVWHVINLNDPDGATSTQIIPAKEYYTTDEQKIDSFQVDLSFLAGRPVGYIAIRNETMGPFSRIEIRDFRIVKNPSCVSPDNVTVKDITSTGAKLEWRSSSGNFEIRANTTEFSPNNDLSEIPINLTTIEQSISLTNLLPGKLYHVYIRSKCREDDSSKWVKVIFKTHKEISEFPWVENFESFPTEILSNFDTLDWTIVDGNGDGYGHFRGFYYFQSVNSGKVVGIIGPGKRISPRDQWLITPRIVLPEKASGKELFLSFVVGNTYQDRLDRFSVSVSTAESIDTTSFQDVLAEIRFNTNNKFKPVTLDLSKYAGKKIFIAIRSITNDHSGGMYVDDFTIDEAGSGTQLPKNITIDKPVSNSVTLSWDKDVAGAPKYNVRYQEYIFKPGDISEAKVAPSTSQKNITLTNLSTGRLYYIYVQAEYSSSNTSPWVGPIMVTIPCVEITTPFRESFDGWIDAFEYAHTGPYTMGCWKYINTRSPETDKQANDIIDAVSNSDVIYSPWEKGKGLSLSTYGDIEADTLTRYLISPPILFPQNGIVMSYWISSTVNSDVSYSIWVSPGNTVADFEKGKAQELYSEVIPLVSSGNLHNFTYKTINLQSKIGDMFPNQVMYVAFVIKGKNQMSFRGVNLDDIALEAIIPGCSYPSDIKSTPIHESSNLTLSWTSNATSFEVAYSDTIFNPLETPTIGKYLLNIPNDKLLGGSCILDLQAGKKYYVWVRGKCNEEYTRWSYITAFGGCGIPIEVSKENSYIYDFSYWEANKMPDATLCWRTLDNGAGAFVGSQNGAVSEGSIPPGATVNSWLISPRIALSKTDSLVLRIAYSGISLNQGFIEKFDVLISKKGSSEGDFTVLKSDVFVDFRATEAPLDLILDLSSFKGDTVYFAILRKATNNNEAEITSPSFLVKNFNVMVSKCPIPYNVTIGEITAENKVTISWEEERIPDSFFRYDFENFNPNESGISEYIPSEKEWSITIPERTNAVFYIRSCCGGEYNERAWIGPFAIENCKPVTQFPYKEDFEKWSANPDFSGCWTLFDEDQDRKGFVPSQLIPESIVPSRNNSKSVGVLDNLSVEGDSKMVWNNWMISPELDFSNPNSHFMLDFWAKSGAEALYSTGDKLNVYVCNGLLNPSAITSKSEYYKVEDTIFIESGYWQKIHLELQAQINKIKAPGAAVGPVDLSKMRIAIQHCSDSSYFAALMIDDLSIENWYGCEPISTPKIDEVTSNKATISWIQTEDLDGKVDIYYNIGMFDNQALSSDIQSKPAGTDLERYTVTLDNLVSGAEYYYYIRNKCNSTTTTWNGPYQFKTDCDSIVSYPYKEDFDIWVHNKRRDFGCWNVVDQNNDKVSFTGTSNGTGPGAVRYFTIETKDTVNDWVISPAMLIPIQPILTATYRTGTHIANVAFMIGEKSKVKRADGSFDLTKFDTLKNYVNHLVPKDSIFLASETDNKKILDYIGKTVYFAVYLYSSTSDSILPFFLLDDFSLTSSHPCLLPPLDFTVDLASDDVKVTWKPATNQTKWELQYWKEGSIDTTRAIVENADSLILVLYPYTKYNIRIRSICSDDPEVSGGPWVSKIFTTEATCKGIKYTTIKTQVTHTTASISWDLSSGIYGYEFSWNESGGSDIFDSIFVGADKNSTLLNELLPNTTYQYRIRKICIAEVATGDTSVWRESIIKTWVHCPALDHRDFSSVSEKKSVVLRWKKIEENETKKYIVEYRPSGSTNWISSDPINGTITSAQLSGLLPNSPYEWRIISECEPGNFVESEIATFVTKPLDRYTVQGISSNNDYGRVEGGGTFDEETEITLTAISNEGYKLMNWTTGSGLFLLDSSLTYKFTLEENRTVRANFDIMCYTPTELVAEVTRPDSTVLVWQGVHTNYTVKYREVNSPSFLEIKVTGKKLTLLNLRDKTSYEWYVMSDCGKDNTSENSTAGRFTAEYVGINQVDPSAVKVDIIPNPVKSNQSVSVHLSGVQGKLNYSILDVTGKVLAKKEVILPSEIKVDLSGYASGIYFVHLQGEGWVKVEKLIIQ